MLLQKVISSARLGAAKAHPEMILSQRRNGHILSTKGEKISTPMNILYGTVFLVGSLGGPMYIFLRYKKLREQREES